MQCEGSSNGLGILLDLDGTIVDCMPLLKETFILTASKVRVTVDHDQSRRIGQAIGAIMEGRPTRLSDLRFIWRIGRILSLPWHKKVALLLVSYLKLRQTARQAPPVKGVVESIQRLKKNPDIKLALVTSRSRKDAIDKLRSLNLLELFDAIVTRDDVDSFKPSSEQVEVAARLLGLPIRRCVLVGDMPTDIDAAKKVSAFSVAVATGIFFDETRAREPDLIIRSLTDLPNFVGEISNRLDRQEEVKGDI